MTKHHPTPNDDRSRVMNPTSTDHKAAADNRAMQLNSQTEEYTSSRGENKK